MNPNDLVILNQAKALEGMRQRLRSHMMKLTDRQKMIDKMEQMIARRDERICQLEKNLNFSNWELKKALADRPEGYDQKCQELAKAKVVITEMQRLLRSLGMEVTVTSSV